MTSNAFPQRIYLSAPHLSGRESELVAEALRSNWVAPLGPNVDAFEKAIAVRSGRPHAAALSSGTAALHLALRLLGVGEGDHVLCSTLTFAGGVNPILYERGTPVFIDAEAGWWGMSPAALERALSSARSRGLRVKAVIIANLYGQSADYDALLSICETYGVPAIEDAAESLGASYKGRPSGSFGLMSLFSFNGNKIITTSGGGMLVSDDDSLIRRARHLATQAREPAPHYEHKEAGYNYRMSNILAAIGLAQLEVLDQRIKRKHEILGLYVDRLSGLPGVSFMPIPHGSKPNGWLTVMLLDPKETKVGPADVMQILGERNVESRPVWKPMHLQPLYAGADYFADGPRSVSDQLFDRGLCLPSTTSLMDDDVHRICDVIESVFKGTSR